MTSINTIKDNIRLVRNSIRKINDLFEEVLTVLSIDTVKPKIIIKIHHFLHICQQLVQNLYALDLN